MMDQNDEPRMLDLGARPRCLPGVIDQDDGPEMLGQRKLDQNTEHTANMSTC